LYVARLAGFTNGGVNPTGRGVTGTTTVLAPFVLSATGLKYSVSICGETGSISLADGVGVGFATGSAIETVGCAFVAGAEMGATGTALVGAEIAGETADSVLFVGFGGSTSAGGSTNEVGIAVARENRSGDGPVCFK